jgi:hypothetical protein
MENLPQRSPSLPTAVGVGVAVLRLQTPPTSGTCGSSSAHTRPGPHRGSGGQVKARQRSPSFPNVVDVGAVGPVGVVGGLGLVVRRQDDFPVSVSVYVAHPVGQAVWHGISAVVVGVLRQRLLGPGMVVVVR